MKANSLAIPLLLLAATVPFIAGSGPQSDSAPLREIQARISALEKEVTKLKAISHRPELGEIMSFIQMRHAKLWFAGESENWGLAAFETHELKESFEDVGKYHPTHGKAAVPLATLIPQLLDPPLGELEKSVQAGDKSRFAAAFDRVTAGCNVCHQAAGYTFNVVKRPTSPPFSNQEFAVQK
jgi:hypothetical protein